MKKNESGRTILEVLAVIAVMAILLMAGMSGYSFLIQRFHRYEAVKDVTELVSSLRVSGAASKHANGQVIPVRTVVKGATTVDGGNILKLPDGDDSYLVVRSLTNGSFALMLQAEKATCDEILQALGKFTPDYDYQVKAVNSEGEEILETKKGHDAMVAHRPLSRTPSEIAKAKAAAGDDPKKFIEYDNDGYYSEDKPGTYVVDVVKKYSAGLTSVGALREASKYLVGTLADPNDPAMKKSSLKIARIEPEDAIGCELAGGGSGDDEKGYAFIPVCVDKPYFCDGECSDCPCGEYQDPDGKCCAEAELCEGMCGCPDGYVRFEQDGACACVECTGGEHGTNQGLGNSQCQNRAAIFHWDVNDSGAWWASHACDLKNQKCVECVTDDDCIDLGPGGKTSDNAGRDFNPFYAKYKHIIKDFENSVMCDNHKCKECTKSWGGKHTRSNRTVGECIGAWVADSSRNTSGTPLCREDHSCGPCCGIYNEKTGECIVDSNFQCEKDSRGRDQWKNPASSELTDNGECKGKQELECAYCWDSESGANVDTGCSYDRGGNICYTAKSGKYDKWNVNQATGNAGTECVRCVDTASGKNADVGCSVKDKTPICVPASITDAEKSAWHNGGTNGIGGQCVECLTDADCEGNYVCDPNSHRCLNCSEATGGKKPYGCDVNGNEVVEITKECFACVDSKSGGATDDGCPDEQPLCIPDKEKCIVEGIVSRLRGTGTNAVGSTCSACLNDNSYNVWGGQITDATISQILDTGCIGCSVDGCTDARPLCDATAGGYAGTNKTQATACHKCFDSKQNQDAIDLGCPVDEPVCYSAKKDANGNVVEDDNGKVVYLAKTYGDECVRCYDSTSYTKDANKGIVVGVDEGCTTDAPMCNSGKSSNKGNKVKGERCVKCYDSATKDGQDMGCTLENPVCSGTAKVNWMNGGTGYEGTVCGPYEPPCSGECFFSGACATCSDSATGARNDCGCEFADKPLCVPNESGSGKNRNADWTNNGDGGKAKGTQCIRCFDSATNNGIDEGCSGARTVRGKMIEGAPICSDEAVSSKFKKGGTREKGEVCYQCLQDSDCLKADGTPIYKGRTKCSSKTHKCIEGDPVDERCKDTPELPHWDETLQRCVACNAHYGTPAVENKVWPCLTTTKPLCDLFGKDGEEPTYTCGPANGSCPPEKPYKVVINGKETCIECNANYGVEPVEGKVYPCLTEVEPICDVSGKNPTYTCGPTNGSCPTEKPYVDPETGDCVACLDDQAGESVDSGCSLFDEKLCKPTQAPTKNGTQLGGDKCLLCQNNKFGSDARHQRDFGCFNTEKLCEANNSAYGTDCHKCQDDKAGADVDAGCNEGDAHICVVEKVWETKVENGISTTVEVAYEFDKKKVTQAYGAACAKCYDDAIYDAKTQMTIDTGCDADKPICSDADATTAYQNWSTISKKSGDYCYECLTGADCAAKLSCTDPETVPVCLNYECVCKPYCLDDQSGIRQDTGCGGDSELTSGHSDRVLCKSDADPTGNGPKAGETTPRIGTSGCYKCQDSFVQKIEQKADGSYKASDADWGCDGYDNPYDHLDNAGQPSSTVGKWICGTDTTDGGKGYYNECYQCLNDEHCAPSQVCVDHQCVCPEDKPVWDRQKRKCVIDPDQCECPEGKYLLPGADEECKCVDCNAHYGITAEEGKVFPCSDSENPLCDTKGKDGNDAGYTCGPCPDGTYWDEEAVWDNDLGRCVKYPCTCDEGYEPMITEKGECVCVPVPNECPANKHKMFILLGEKNGVKIYDMKCVECNAHYGTTAVENEVWPCSEDAPVCDLEGANATYTCGECPKGEIYNEKTQSCTLCYDSHSGTTPPDAGCKGKTVEATDRFTNEKETRDANVCAVPNPAYKTDITVPEFLNTGSNEDGDACYECVTHADCPQNKFCDNDHTCQYCNDWHGTHEGQRPSQNSLEACGCPGGQQVKYGDKKATGEPLNGGHWYCSGCTQHSDCDENECCSCGDGMVNAQGKPVTPCNKVANGVGHCSNDVFDKKNTNSETRRAEWQNKCICCPEGHFFNYTTGTCSGPNDCEEECGHWDNKRKECVSDCKDNQICIEYSATEYTYYGNWSQLFGATCPGGKRCGKNKPRCVTVPDEDQLITLEGAVTGGTFKIPPADAKYKMPEPSAERFCAHYGYRLADLRQACNKDEAYDSGHDCPNISKNVKFSIIIDTEEACKAIGEGAQWKDGACKITTKSACDKVSGAVWSNNSCNYALSSWGNLGTSHGTFWLINKIGGDNTALRVTYSCGNNHAQHLCNGNFPLCFKEGDITRDCPVAKPHKLGAKCVECDGDKNARTAYPCTTTDKPLCRVDRDDICVTCASKYPKKPTWDDRQSKCVECNGNLNSGSSIPCKTEDAPVCKEDVCTPCPKGSMWIDNKCVPCGGSDECLTSSNVCIKLTDYMDIKRGANGRCECYDVVRTNHVSERVSCHGEDWNTNSKRRTSDRKRKYYTNVNFYCKRQLCIENSKVDDFVYDSYPSGIGSRWPLSDKNWKYANDHREGQIDPVCSSGTIDQGQAWIGAQDIWLREVGLTGTFAFHCAQGPCGTGSKGGLSINATWDGGSSTCHPLSKWVDK